MLERGREGVRSMRRVCVEVSIVSGGGDMVFCLMCSLCGTGLIRPMVQLPPKLAV